MYLFTPPGRVERRGNHPLFGRLRLTQGVSLLKVLGLYRQVSEPSDEEISAAQVTYLGGHTYLISNAEATALTAAGYADFVAPLSPAGYGSGAYGDGNYGESTPSDAYGSGAYGAGPYGEE